MLADFTNWVLDLIDAVLVALWDFLADVFTELLDLLLTAILAVVAAIPVPAFLSSGLSSLFNALDPAVIYFLTMFGLPQALAMFGTAFVFRLARKVITLFQW